MAKRKSQSETTTVATADDIYGRVGMFFQSLPYRQPGTWGELSQDMPDVELKKYFKEEEEAAKLAELEKNGFQLPKAKAERAEMARQKLLETVVDEMVKDGRLTRSVITSSNAGETKETGIGYIWTGERPADAVGRLVSKFPIDQIKVDERLQQRENGVNLKRVDEYAAVADRLPPIRLWHTPEDEYYMSRGFHRLPAMRKAGMSEVPVEIFEGDRNAALLDAIGDNAEHGLPRTSADIYKAVGSYLGMKGNAMASTASIAKAVKIGWQTARDYAKKWRKEQQAARDARKAAGQQTAEDKEAEAAQAAGVVQTADGRQYPASIEQPASAATTGNTVTHATDKPAATTDPLPLPAHPHGVKDKIGNDVPPELAGAFLDTRIADKIGEALRAFDFIRRMETDGYSACALSVKDRDAILATVETELQTLQYSLPYAVTPKDASGKAFAGARERGWMTHDEHTDYLKSKSCKPAGKGGKKNGKPAADPVEPNDSNSQAESCPPDAGTVDGNGNWVSPDDAPAETSDHAEAGFAA